MKEHQTEVSAIQLALQQAQRILTISHQKPDGDTLGSSLALTSYLKSLGKEVHNFCVDPVPGYLTYLPGSHLVSQDQAIFNQPFDAVVVFDSGSLDYAGVADRLPLLVKPYTLINIDHHASNPFYGHLNLVLIEASSTCEVVTRLLQSWQVPISSAMASCLLTGLITDTGALTNPAAHHQTFELVGSLITAGADPYSIIQRTMKIQSLTRLKLWGRALARLQVNSRYQLATTYITWQDQLDCQADTEAMEGLANYLAVLNSARFLMILRETEDGLIKGSLRTPFNKPNLSRLAVTLGGGGHKKASGFTISGKIMETAGGWHII